MANHGRGILPPILDANQQNSVERKFYGTPEGKALHKLVMDLGVLLREVFPNSEDMLAFCDKKCESALTQYWALYLRPPNHAINLPDFQQILSGNIAYMSLHYPTILKQGSEFPGSPGRGLYSMFELMDGETYRSSTLEFRSMAQIRHELKQAHSSSDGDLLHPRLTMCGSDAFPFAMPNGFQLEKLLKHLADHHEAIFKLWQQWNEERFTVPMKFLKKLAKTFVCT